MTEKRFKLVDIGFVYDNDKLIGMKEIVDLLNELDEKYVDEFSLRETLQQELQRVENENEELKEKVNFYKYFQKDARELGKENLDLSEELDYYKTKCASLETGLFQADKENEQLKSKIKELEIKNEAQSDAIDGLQGFIAHYDLENLE